MVLNAVAPWPLSKVLCCPFRFDCPVKRGRRTAALTPTGNVLWISRRTTRPRARPSASSASLWIRDRFQELRSPRCANWRAQDKGSKIPAFLSFFSPLQNGPESMRLDADIITEGVSGVGVGPVADPDAFPSLLAGLKKMLCLRRQGLTTLWHRQVGRRGDPLQPSGSGASTEPPRASPSRASSPRVDSALSRGSCGTKADQAPTLLKALRMVASAPLPNLCLPLSGTGCGCLRPCLSHVTHAFPLRLCLSHMSPVPTQSVGRLALHTPGRASQVGQSPPVYRSRGRTQIRRRY